MSGWDAPEPEWFEGNPEHESAHFGQNPVANMGHGDTCNHCNDAIMNDYENELKGRNNKSFNYGAAKHNSQWILDKKFGGEIGSNKKKLGEQHPNHDRKKDLE